jgi:hypothetical protein
MVSILITAAAHEAIRSLFPDTTAVSADGAMVKIWLDRDVLSRLRSLRGSGESYSDVILRLAKEERE